MTQAPSRTPAPHDTGVLEDFLEQAVADDYADVPVSDGAGQSRGWHWRAWPALLLIGLLIAVALLSTRASDDQRQRTREALVERVTALTATVSSRQDQVQEQAAAVDALRATMLDDAALNRLTQQADGLAASAAAAELSGPGLTVTVDDAPDAAAGSLNRVLDRDLQDIVNALWQMGASGIAVNGQRLTAATAIRGAGEAILVNYQPLTRPYVISAVGTTTSGGGDSGLQVLLDGLTRDYGLVSEVSTGDVALPAGEVRAPRFATVREGEQQ